MLLCKGKSEGVVSNTAKLSKPSSKKMPEAHATPLEHDSGGTNVLVFLEDIFLRPSRNAFQSVMRARLNSRTMRFVTLPTDDCA